MSGRSRVEPVAPTGAAMLALVGNLTLMSAPPILAAQWWLGGTPARLLSSALLATLVAVSLCAALEAGLTDQLGVAERVDYRNRRVRLESLAALAVLAGFWAAALEYLVQRTSPGDPLAVSCAIAGVATIAAGGALRGAAIHVLGSRFAALGDADRLRRLATTRLYARLRHPSESGLLLIQFGTALALQSGAALGLLAVVSLPLTWLRLRREERELCREFADYASYRIRVGALIPRWSRRSKIAPGSPASRIVGG